jgi:hypothetical protein
LLPTHGAGVSLWPASGGSEQLGHRQCFQEVNVLFSSLNGLCDLHVHEVDYDFFWCVFKFDRIFLVIGKRFVDDVLEGHVRSITKQLRRFQVL